MSPPRVCWQLSLKWGAGMAELEPEPHVSWGFFYVQCLTPPHWGWVQFPRCQRRWLEAQIQAGSVLSVCSVLSPALKASLQMEAELEQERPDQAPSAGQDMYCGGPIYPVRVLDHSDLLPLRVPARAAFAPFRCSTKYKPALSPVTAHSHWQQQPSSQRGAPLQRKRGQSGPSLWAKVHGWLVMENYPESWEVPICLLSLDWGTREHVRELHKWSPSFSQCPPPPAPPSPIGLQANNRTSSLQQDSSSWYGMQSLVYPICGLNHLLPGKYLQV